MSAKFICPAQIRKNVHPFLMCELAKEDGVDYNLRENAYKIACPYQHYCPHTKRPENTAEYEKCYKAKTAPVVETKAAAEEIPATAEEAEEQPKTEKTARKKAKD